MTTIFRKTDLPFAKAYVAVSTLLLIWVETPVVVQLTKSVLASTV